jgi:ABC-2 type transport system ATP-binding protein
VLKRSLVAAVSVLLVACSATQRGNNAPTSVSHSIVSVGPTSSSTTVEPQVGSHCPPVGGEPVSRRVDEDSFDVRAFDGVWLRVNFFGSPEQPAPTLLSSPGWASRGVTLDRPGDRIAGSLAIGALNADGYNVVSWDRRGAGDSGGVVAMGSLATEGRDVVTIVDWIAAQPGVELDSPNDPRLGMFGGSYGGAIQLVATAADCRIDAIVPNMVGASWRTALAPAETAKVGWINLLYSSIDEARLEPQFVRLTEVANDDGAITKDLVDYLDARSATQLLNSVRVPTLLLQGTVDTLFTLRQSTEIYDSLRARGVPTAMIWYCGGHGNCPVSADDAWLEAATVAWFDRYVRRRSDAPTVSSLTVTDQTGKRWTSSGGLAPGDVLHGVGAGSLVLELASRTGPAPATDSTSAGMSNVMRLISPSVVASNHALEVDVAVPVDTLVVGSPTVRMRCRGTGPQGTAPTRVFAQVVDPETDSVIGGQITPIAVDLDGQRHAYDVDLESVVWHAQVESVLRLQIVAVASLFAPPRLGGRIECDSIEIRLPTSARFVLAA